VYAQAFLSHAFPMSQHIHHIHHIHHTTKTTSTQRGVWPHDSYWPSRRRYCEEYLQNTTTRNPNSTLAREWKREPDTSLEMVVDFLRQFPHGGGGGEGPGVSQ
jgi:hypothetical protein